MCLVFRLPSGAQPPSLHPHPFPHPFPVSSLLFGMSRISIMTHLIGCLIGQSTRALIKNKNETTTVDVAARRWAERQHVRVYTYMLVLCVRSNYRIHSACVGIQHFHQRHFNYNTHISNCFYYTGSIAIIPYVAMLECRSLLRPRTECAGDALKSNHGLKIISTSQESDK